jgi:2-enoate reductase
LGIGGLVGLSGTFSDRAIDYYERRALGGVGLIITGLCLVNSTIEPVEVDGVSPLVTFDSLWKIRNFNELTERVHDHGAKIFVQLTAGFGRVLPRGLAEKAREKLVAPTSSSIFGNPNIIAREMSKIEIESLIKSFGNAAIIAKKSGFDGIELHGHEGYLMDQFTSALWNKRTDEYGGDIAGRMNFVLSVLEEIQGKVGTNFPVIYRYGVEHKIDGGRTTEEGIEIAKILEKAKIAALHVDAGCYENWYWPHPPIYQPPGCMVEMAERVKANVGIPVITVGRLGYADLANEICKEGKADFIALGRPLLADPDFVAKIRRGEEQEIRPCIGCHECATRILRQQSLSCAVNPKCGDERRLAVNVSSKRKRVMVVGGGIAGMVAAQVCCKRGHIVSLFEKTDRLGGNLNAASKADFKRDILSLLNYQVNQLRKVDNLKINMNAEVTREIIQKEQPETVFIATGSEPIRDINIKGLENVPYIAAKDVYEGNICSGSSALVIGGGTLGCETALYLAKQNWSVSVIEILFRAASDIFESNRQMLFKLMKEYGVRIFTDAEVSEVKIGRAIVSSKKGEREFPVDLIVLALGSQPVNDLVEASESMIAEIHVIGDCFSPGKIKDAVWGAFKRARTV